MITIQTVNEIGLKEIREFLRKTHIKGETIGFDGPDLLRAWAEEAEFQMGEGNPPSIEILSCNSLTGKTETYTISEAGISTEVVYN